MTRPLTSIALAAACALLLPACGGGGMGPPGATPDFTLGVSPGTITATVGTNSTAATISVSGLNGFTGNVIVSITGLPQGATTNPAQPFAVAASSSQALTIFVPPNTAPGNIALTITGTSGLRNHAAALVLTVLPAPIADFSIEAAPGSVTAFAGGTSNVLTVSVIGRGGFSGNVSLRLSGLPPGATTTPALPFALAPGKTMQLSINVPSDTSAGSVGLVLTAEGDRIVHTAPVILSIARD